MKAVLFCFLAAASFWDIRRGIVPNSLAAAAALAGVLAGGTEFAARFLPALAAAAIVYRTRLFGGGDLKALALVFALAGAADFCIIVPAGCAVCLLVKTIRALAGREAFSASFPLIPYLFAGAVLTAVIKNI